MNIGQAVGNSVLYTYTLWYCKHLRVEKKNLILLFTKRDDITCIRPEIKTILLHLQLLLLHLAVETFEIAIIFVFCNNIVIGCHIKYT